MGEQQRLEPGVRLGVQFPAQIALQPKPLLARRLSLQRPHPGLRLSLMCT